MSKHDIRMRRNKFGGRGSDRFRNYGDVLERHEKEMRIKKVMRVFTYLLIIMIIVLLIVIVVRVEKRAEKNPKTTTLVDTRFSNLKI